MKYYIVLYYVENSSLCSFRDLKIDFVSMENYFTPNKFIEYFRKKYNFFRKPQGIMEIEISLYEFNNINRNIPTLTNTLDTMLSITKAIKEIK